MASLAKPRLRPPTLSRNIEELTAQLEARSEERRTAETRSANQGAALKQMEGETQRIERRLQEWALQAARNKDARETKRNTIEQKREETARLEAEHAQAEAGLEERQAQLDLLRQQREGSATGSGAGDRRAGRTRRAPPRRRGGFPAHRPAACRSRSPRASHRAAAGRRHGRAGAAHCGERRAWPRGKRS